MITVKNNIFNGPLVCFFTPYFVAFSDKQLPRVIKSPKCLQPYFEALYIKLKQPLPTIQDITFTSKEVEVHTNREIIIGFSGGKDGVAVAIKAILKGYKPILFHLYGINRLYKKERDSARILAAKLGLPLIEQHIQIKGKSNFQDHPFKNQLILSYLFDYGTPLGIGNYALGNHKFENERDGNVNIEFSDSIEQMERFDVFLRTTAPQYKRKTWLSNKEDALRTIFDWDKKLLMHISSCVTPHYRKPMFRKYVEKKFGAEVLLPGRCGVYCYKCTKEYLLFVEWGLLPRVENMVAACEDYIANKSPTTYV